MACSDCSSKALPLIETEDQLEEALCTPTKEVAEDLAQLNGDIMILGVAGKIGPSLAQMAVRAVKMAGLNKRVIGVEPTFREPVRGRLEQAGVELIECDLMDREGVAALPEVENIIFMAGRKFGSSGVEHETWALNVYMPGIVAERFQNSRFCVFSSGNIYGLAPVLSGGSDEKQPVRPEGDYAQSVVGRERIFEYASRKYGRKVLMFRLNYAIDLRYGVLLDVAEKVANRQPVDVTMGHYNCIWQGDVNACCLRSLRYASAPPRILNITGPETVPVRWIAQRFGELLEVEPIITGCEAGSALLNNASQAAGLFGYPRVTLEEMLHLIAHWVRIGGPTLGKPTHFETRDGKY